MTAKVILALHTHAQTQVLPLFAEFYVWLGLFWFMCQFQAAVNFRVVYLD